VTLDSSDGAAFVDLLKRKSPEYLSLLTAQTEEEFEEAFGSLLEAALRRLETNSRNFIGLDENGLSAVLAAALEVPGLHVSSEMHSNGHVDLTIDAEHCTPVRRKLGEAKIYDGFSYHVAGLKQLLQRYTTGREGRGLLIVYCRREDIKGKMETLRARMDSSLPCDQQGNTVDHRLRWSFGSAHRHSSGEVCGVDHVGCNLCIG
jgi:hypothetical protein